MRDSHPAQHHAVKASSLKDTPKGPVMLFERDWNKMAAELLAIAAIIICIGYIFAAIIAQDKEEAENK